MPLRVRGITTKVMLETMKGQHCLQKHLHEHFDLSGHTNFMQDVRVTLLKKTDARNPTE